MYEVDKWTGLQFDESLSKLFFCFKNSCLCAFVDWWMNLENACMYMEPCLHLCVHVFVFKQDSVCQLTLSETLVCGLIAGERVETQLGR